MKYLNFSLQHPATTKYNFQTLIKMCNVALSKTFFLILVRKIYEKPCTYF